MELSESPEAVTGVEVRTCTRGDILALRDDYATHDSAAMESFFSLLQKNVLNRRRYDSREQLRIAIVTWIERTYHRRRRQLALGRLTPIEYEAIMTTPASQAA